MRYFFHYGYYGAYPDPRSWVSTNELIEMSEEGYRQTIEHEKEIQKRHRELGVPWRGWHRPVKYKRLPNTATMHEKQPWLERLNKPNAL